MQTLNVLLKSIIKDFKSILNRFFNFKKSIFDLSKFFSSHMSTFYDIDEITGFVSRKTKQRWRSRSSEECNSNNNNSISSSNSNSDNNNNSNNSDNSNEITIVRVSKIAWGCKCQPLRPRIPNLNSNVWVRMSFSRFLRFDFNAIFPNFWKARNRTNS